MPSNEAALCAIPGDDYADTTTIDDKSCPAMATNASPIPHRSYQAPPRIDIGINRCHTPCPWPLNILYASPDSISVVISGREVQPNQPRDDDDEYDDEHDGRSEVDSTVK